jgi:NADH-quinone oxidoreductase subunit M
MVLLNIIIWLPIFAGLFLLAAPLKNPWWIRRFALLVSVIPLVLAMVLFIQLRQGNVPEVQNRLWIESIGLGYSLGISRIGILLAALASLVGTCSVLVSFNVEKRQKEFFGLLLLMVGGISGAFSSLDLFFFYVFHELALIPTFLLVGFWGGPGRREAAIKMTLFLGIGSLVLLLGLIGLYLKSGAHPTFYIPTLIEHYRASPLNDLDQQILFGILFVGFGSLVGLVPIHIWAPDGYAEAPPAAAMLHAGVLKKFGIYGLMVTAIPMLPEGFAAYRNAMGCFGVVTILYAGYVALRQTDLNRMLGYSSVSHMGYAFLGLAAGTASALEGVVILMLAHGLSAALGFAVAGFSYSQAKTREMPGLGGLAKKMPAAASLFSMAALAGCGLPGLGNFVAELLIFIGSFKIFPILTALAAWGVVVSSTYLIRSVKSVYLGPLKENFAEVRDMTWMERLPCFLLAAVLLWIGFLPRSVSEIRGKSPPGDPNQWAQVSQSPR